MILGDYHTHTVYCDGNNTPREMVQAALEMGLPAIGFTGHGETAFDYSYCMTKENTAKYVEDISALKAEYDGRIDVLCGIETDIYSPIIEHNFDYVIGSAHYVKVGNDYCVVDIDFDTFKDVLNNRFGGDALAFCESYFEGVSRTKELVDCDILGHFDLVTKFNELEPLIDVTDKRYINAATDALDVLLKTDVVFEVNSGAISRGYRTSPYPAPFILRYIREKKGRIIINGDTHNKNNLCCDFENSLALVKECGFKSVMGINKNGFYEIKI